MPESAAQPAKPILHALTTLDAQLAAVSAAASSPAFEGVARQVRQLAAEADKVAEARKGGDDEDSLASPTSGDGDDAGRAYLADADRVAKINALYGTLGTIDSLAPTLPLVLERLRTLRLVHASAGGASGLLDSLEERSEEQSKEIKMWRESLDKLEKAVQNGEATTAKNVTTVGEWVRELEARVGKL
jgi:nuclear migration protein JNM1